MGSSSSTRSIAVERDAETGVVKVSEDLLRRMLGEESADQPKHEQPQERDRRRYPATDDYNLKLLNEEWKERLYRSEELWQERLTEAERKNAALLQLSSEKFQQAAEEVEAKFIKHQCVPICQNLQGEVLKCYAANPRRTLNCSQEVNAFNKCVDRSRTSILTKKSLETVS
ncbi:MICOS complex subunit MIC19-like [Acanthaster planci]|uniref:MICOS complex subunit MIC19-like n=1 Tax=Acanthaster planci TaxID=133434 RepID=A0A8B7Z698_ACAPL|nr:MICOS complex subunit MIC19-like [Acanthaster planci]